MKKIIVASTNPVKINAVKQAFETIFPEEKFYIKGVKVASNVSEQPKSDKETLKGALNRAINAYKKDRAAHFWIGIEGGIEKKYDHIQAFAWMVIKSKYKISKAKTGTFILPPQIAQLIEEGKELGEADDIVFKTKNSKQKNGAIGMLTKNIITRTSYYKNAVILALIPFINPELY